MKNKFVRFAALMQIVVLLLGINAIAVSASSVPFRDVPTGSWFHGAVTWAYNNGIAVGTSPTTFSPNSNVTRGQFVAFIHRTEGRPYVPPTLRFTDVPPGHMFANSIAWAVGAGVVHGTSPTTFHPERPITREEIAVMLFRLARIHNRDTSAPARALERFPDRNNISGYADEGVRWAANTGILRGDHLGRLNPGAFTTRAESVAVLQRYVLRLPFTPPENGPNPGPDPNGTPAPLPVTANDQHIWNFFRSRGLGPHATAGLMGNLFAESGLRPNAVERVHRDRIIYDNDWYDNPSFAMIDERYTLAVNTGIYRTSRPQTHEHLITHVNPINSRNSFIFDRVGYGISQWTYPVRKMRMYDFIRNRNGTFDIGCLNAQLEFFWHEVNVFYPGVLSDLRTTTCVVEASNIVLHRLKRPANAHTHEGTRAGFSLGYYDRFEGTYSRGQYE